MIPNKSGGGLFLTEKNKKAGPKGPGYVIEMAEREGFEPSVEVSPHTRLAGERLQPTRPSLRDVAACYLWRRE